MEIGEKIKSLRVSRRMTQAELAGDQITRNMLSLVENGSALPSLPTIMYLSERLGVPAGIFLARESEELIYKKMNEIPKIKNMYKVGEYRLCSDMCEGLMGNDHDDELNLILAMCHFEIAKEEFNSGRLHNSCRELDLACKYSKDTLYDRNMVCSAASIYFNYMLRLSPTLTSDLGYEDYKGEVCCLDTFCRYAIVLERFESGDRMAIETYLRDNDKNDCFSMHLDALLKMSNGDYVSAGRILKSLISENDMDCRVIMYDIFRNYEECCRENGDYKSAYEYSVGKVELLEHMLADINL